ncbi:MAG: hypothetical protein IJB32_03795 [Clostridia bacterium]|nr:hypothetical protein [Clostridia bacterium]
MKKIILFISLILFLGGFCSVYFTTNTANAQAKYLRVITEDTPFYKNVSDTEPLFFLPYTYYVKVLSDGEVFTHVECQVTGSIPAIDGYVPTEMLFDDGLTVSEPYLNMAVKTATTALLFEDLSLTSPLQYVFSDREMIYLGRHVTKNNVNVYYVSYNNRLGYVKESDIYPFSITNHPNELTFIKPDPPIESTPNSPTESVDENNLLSVKILIIASLVFAGIIGLIFAVKHNPKRNTAITFYDENDYE